MLSALLPSAHCHTLNGNRFQKAENFLSVDVKNLDLKT